MKPAFGAMVVALWIGAIQALLVLNIAAYEITQREREAIRSRLRAGDLAPIDELKVRADLDSILELANIATVYHYSGNEERYPGVADAALQAIGQISGAQELIGELVYQGDRPSRFYSERFGLMDLIRRIRNEESVRVMGKLLDDDFDIEVPGAPPDAILGPNSYPAARAFAVWLRNDPSSPLSTADSQWLANRRIWQNWWHKVRDDPEVIRAIAEGRPVPTEDARFSEPAIPVERVMEKEKGGTPIPVPEAPLPWTDTATRGYTLPMIVVAVFLVSAAIMGFAWVRWKRRK